MKLLCLIRHEWQVIESLETSEIEHIAQGSEGWPMRDSPVRVRKVCVRCGRAVDQISKYLAMCKTRFEAQAKRDALAMGLYRASGLPLGKLKKDGGQ